MNEKPIERLNYYNGQRLEASDLKLEQEYHIRMRRWLNKSLYSAGIVDGLEVRPEQEQSNKVIVSPGMAIDAEGREIILLEEQVIDVIAEKSNEGEGNYRTYLTIQYREQTTDEIADSYAPRSNRQGAGHPARRAPSRVRATPILAWSAGLPHPSSGKIVLAQVELDNNSCNVLHVYTYPRDYVGPKSIATVRQYALEGERHIDSNNPGRIYFHIRGRQPNSVTLYLRAEQFSTLFYTEMGQHVHMPTSGGTTRPASKSLTWSHSHSLSEVTTKTTNDGEHDNHELQITYAGAASNVQDRRLIVADMSGLVGDVTGGTEEIEILGVPVTVPTPPIIAFVGAGKPVYGNILPVLSTSDKSFTAQINRGSHYHSFDGNAVTETRETDFSHTHPINTDGVLSDAGVSDVLARSEPDPKKPQAKALTFITDLQVYISKADPTGIFPEPLPALIRDPNRYTTEILTQLHNSGIWADTYKELGNGTDGHPFATHGAGPIRLDLLAPRLSFAEGSYCIELRVKSGGGRILYNLYVE